jgi:hypothetical protein
VDAAISVLAHELTEAATDPQMDGWKDSNGWENADKCAWNFLNVIQSSSGYSYNVQIGTRKYYIQSNWKQCSQSCAMA